MEHKIHKAIARQERKYERTESPIERARIIKKCRSLVRRLSKKGYHVPEELSVFS